MNYQQKLLLLMITAFGFAIFTACEPGRNSHSAVPAADFTGSPGTGKAVYNRLCQRCHGENALGSPTGPPLVHKFYEPSHHGDMAFYMAARNGVRSHHWHFGDMPAIPSATPEDVGHVIAYVRQEQRKAGIK
ncbi:MAG: cytochrome c [Gammaproteobacteria bacterium]|nr:cytochrome c [Gammaproteobacteria bacterium]